MPWDGRCPTTRSSGTEFFNLLAPGSVRLCAPCGPYGATRSSGITKGDGIKGTQVALGDHEGVTDFYLVREVQDLGRTGHWLWMTGGK
jgi:hypothetical protein